MFKRVGTYWHLFPEQTQARRAIWNGIDGKGRRIIDQFLPPEVRKRKSDQEMLIEVLNGSIWQMAGSDNYDSLVGSNPIGVVFSEWSLAHPEAWDYIRPILVENNGWALFIYTPRGRNHGYATYRSALDADDWFAERLTVDDTGLVSKEQIDKERQAGMSDGKVRQEFYCSFEAESDEQLISFAQVAMAQERESSSEDFAERVMGVDVARFGDDHSVIYYRHGRDGTQPYERYTGMDTMTLAARVAERIQVWRPDAVFIDEGGVGGGVVDRLHQLNFDVVRGVNFGSRSDSARSGERAGNKRTEMWLNMRSWLTDKGALPEDELLAAELTGPMYGYNSSNDMILEKKEDMKKRGIPSPDVADALALTFAYPVQPQEDDWEEYYGDDGRSEVTGY